MAVNLEKRKHRLDDSDIVFSNKRVKVEQLLLNLLLENNNEVPTVTDFNVNPLIDFSNDLIKKLKQTGIDSMISEKIYQSYKNRVLEGLTMIRYMLPITVLILHFHIWVKRLFNNFIRKFNCNHPNGKQVGLFRSYYKIMAIVEDPKINFTYANLYDVVIQENEIEARSLIMKRDHKLDSKKIEELRESETLVKECNYKYWDRMNQFPGDIEMEDCMD